MGLMNKLKNILFEEEEVEIPIIEKKAKKESASVSKEIPREEVKERYNADFYEDLTPTINRESKMEEEAKSSDGSKDEAIVSDREMFKSEKTFNFPAFDEEEFQSVSKVTRQNNVLERESKKAPKTEYKRIEKTEVVEKTKFKPSPIISPVYGILDKNYTPDEITSRVDTSRRLDFDSVRNKAFGKVEEPKEEILEEEIEEDNDNKILEEKLEKARTIDELLKDSSDEVIPLRKNIEEKEEEVINEDESDAIISLDETEKEEKKKEDDTLESDLFDLIDSMYENREDGE